MRKNWPDQYINTKVTAGFFLLLIVAVLAFGINYFGVVRHLKSHPQNDPVGQRLLLLNELILKMQEVDRATRIYVLTGRQRDRSNFHALNDSVQLLLDRLGWYFPDSVFQLKVDTLKELYDQKCQHIEQLFELSDINRYRQRYEDILILLPDSFNYQISHITYMHLRVDSVETTEQSKSGEEKNSFLGRIARFLSGSKEEKDTVRIAPTPKIRQIVDSSLITQVRKDPAIEKVKEQLQVLIKQDRHFSNLLLTRERALSQLDDQLTQTIRQILYQLQQEALAESDRYQSRLGLMRKDLLHELIFLGISALIIIFGFVIWINRDLKKSRNLKEQLVKSKEKVESLMKIKERFLANMSHEIRTPLTSIIGFSELLKTDNANAEIIHNSAHHLLALVNDILDMSQMNEGKLTLQQETIFPEELIKEVWQFFIRKARQKNLHFTYSVINEVPVFRGDKTRLQQILINLVGNAVKFTDEGEVWICLRKEDNSLLFEVGDTGPGISESDSADIFEEFTRLHSETIASAGGSGLGLSISKKLVEAMDGAIGYQNNKDKGCTFWFRIPLQLPEINQPKTKSPNLEKLGFNNILVVDDDPLILQLLQGFLQHHSNVRGVSSPKEAAKIIEEEAFDLIITDYRMPEISGIDFIKMIREKNNVPMLLLSAAANQYLLDEIARIKNVAFLPKPFSKSDLINSLGRLRNKNIAVNEFDYQNPNIASSLFDLTSVFNFTGNDKAFFASVVMVFVNETNENIAKLSVLVRKKEYEPIPDLAHKMLTGFRQYSIDEGISILKGIEVMGKHCDYAQLKKSLKRLKTLWNQVEKGLVNVLEGME